VHLANYFCTLIATLSAEAMMYACIRLLRTVHSAMAHDASGLCEEDP
jgi:hypothetical protein